MVRKKGPEQGNGRVSGNQQRRDIIAIGASAGGVEALKILVSGFPPDLAASIFVVVHISPVYPSVLPDILTRFGPLPAVHARNGEAILPGRIYVAPPDHHLTLEPGFIRTARGPRENGHRPAVDPLFRTAARAYGPRAVGVVLTGALDCGTDGLMSIKSRGGVAIVQDPNEALSPEMPQNAIKHVRVDHILPLAKISSLIAKLARESVGEEVLAMATKPIKERSVFTCPECNGSMVESERGSLIRFECHVGHVFSMEGMAAAQAEELEAALWAGVRALEESEALARRMALRSDRKLAVRLVEKAEAMRTHAQLLQKMLLGGDWMLSSAETVKENRLARKKRK